MRNCALRRPGLLLSLSILCCAFAASSGGCAAIAGLDGEFLVGDPNAGGATGTGTATGTATGSGTSTGSNAGGAAAAGAYGGGQHQGGAGGGQGTGLTDVLQTGDVLLFYGSGDSDTPRMRTWTAASDSWSAPEMTTAASSRIRWVVTPETLRWPVMLGVLSGETTTQLDLLRHDGSGWIVDWSVTDIDIANVNRRGFDIAYEDSSGDVMVVYSNDTGVPQYRTYESGAWSAEQPVLSDQKAEEVRWVELAARPGTDELALLYNDGAFDLTAVIWDGQGWGSKTVLETNLYETLWLSFAAAYETQSGDLVAFWARDESGALGFIWATRPAGGTFTSPVIAPAPLLQPGPARLRPEPGTDRMALSYVEYTCGGQSCDDFIGAVWDGSGWTHATRIDPEINTPYHNYPGAIPVDVAWVTGDELCSVYTELSTGLDWAKWVSGGGAWVLQADEATASGLGPRVNVQGLSVEGRSEALFLMSYDNRSLVSYLYGGSTWTGPSTSLESDLSSKASVPFAAAMKR
ncbi:MAG: hypothetical protein JRI23_20865 [Deltaproteobacteria bacterium]|jgi:hypothetical protein|nr:hypothetical protein [Deltaproteobacteria bacterium]MBW2534374.1 hypothetical protein [Deltaproteobacteria bacterium]